MVYCAGGSVKYGRWVVQHAQPSPARINFCSKSVCAPLMQQRWTAHAHPLGTGPRLSVKPREAMVLCVKLSRGDGNKHIRGASALLHSPAFSHSAVWKNTEPKSQRFTLV